MTKQGTILVVDDNKGILTAVQMLLGTCFEKVITISTPNKIKATLHDENIDVVYLDMISVPVSIPATKAVLAFGNKKGRCFDTGRSFHGLC